MFSDKWDDEIQSKSPVEYKTQKQINRSLTHACLVLFSSFHAIGVELKCGVHSHWDIANSSSKQVGNIAFTQHQSAKSALKAIAEVQASANKTKPNKPFIFQLIVGFKHAKCLRSQALCIVFRRLACPSVASTNMIKANLDVGNLLFQIFNNIVADSNFIRYSSSIIRQMNKMCSASQMVRNYWQ